MLVETPPVGFTKRILKHGPYSPSKLITAKCPASFFGRYIRKDISSHHSMSAAKGNATHHVMRKITESIIAKEVVKPHVLDSWVNEGVGKFPAAYDYIDLIKEMAVAFINKPSPYIMENTTCEYAIAINLYVENSFVDDYIPAIRFVEVPYEIEGRRNPDAFFVARFDEFTVDEVQKIVTILDHKTTPAATKNEDHMFQMGCYAWLASLKYPGYSIRTVLRYGHPSLNFCAAPMYWDEEEIKQVENYVMMKIGAIESFDDFPAIPGSTCEYCPLIQDCPVNTALIDQKARGIVDLNVRSFVDLERIAQQLTVIGALYDSLNKALKAGIETYAKDGVSVDGIWYGNKPTDEAVNWIATDIKIREMSAAAKQALVDDQRLTDEQRTLYRRQAEIPSLNELLKKYGINNPDNFKEWKKEKLNAIWKLEKPELLDLLKAYVVTEKSTRFGAHKSRH